jgi:hypothetical protein
MLSFVFPFVTEHFLNSEAPKAFVFCFPEALGRSTPV